MSSRTFLDKIQFRKIFTLSRPLAPLQGEIDICARGLFRMKFNFEQFLLGAFFDAMRIFGSLGHKLNVIFHISTYSI